MTVSISTVIYVSERRMTFLFVFFWFSAREVRLIIALSCQKIFLYKEATVYWRKASGRARNGASFNKVWDNKLTKIGEGRLDGSRSHVSQACYIVQKSMETRFENGNNKITKKSLRFEIAMHDDDEKGGGWGSLPISCRLPTPFYFQDVRDTTLARLVRESLT